MSCIHAADYDTGRQHVRESVHVDVSIELAEKLKSNDHVCASCGLTRILAYHLGRKDEHISRMGREALEPTREPFGSRVSNG